MATRTRRITVDEYHKMAEAGILGEDDRVELIGGEIVQMSPVGGRHVEVVGKLTRLLVRAAGDEWRVNVQSPISVPPYGEPEPDLAVVREREYGLELPTPKDVLLIIEVADTSLEHDSRVKLPLYASVGIPEAWLVDLEGGLVERRTDPSNGRYRSTYTAGPGESIESGVLAGLVLNAGEVLGIRG